MVEVEEFGSDVEIPKGLGVEDLKIYVFPQYKPGEAYSPEEAKKAVTAADELQKILLTLARLT